MGGHNGLRHRGHAHGVRAQHPGGTDLRRRFVLGAGEVHIDALAQGDGQLLRGLPGGVLESGRVHMAHVRESGAELLQVGAAKGADTEEFDVVGNQHDVPGREGGVHRAGSVGDYQRFRPQQPQHPDRIADILKGPALIGVEAALHHRHVLTRQAAEHEPARVVRGGGSLHVGHILIGDIPGVSMVNFMRAALNEHRKYKGLEPVSATDFLKLMREKRAIVELDNKLASRSVNEGFSGGEKKRNEIFQMAMLEPKLAILDETDSGLDIDALRIVANGVNQLRTPENAAIVITHYQRLLDYIKPDVVHVLYKGRIVKTAGPELALELEEKGYDWIKKEMGDE